MSGTTVPLSHPLRLSLPIMGNGRLTNVIPTKNMHPSTTKQLGLLTLAITVVLALTAGFASLARAQSAPMGTTTTSYVFEAHLLGSNEVPPITGTSTGTTTASTTGHVRVWFDLVKPATTSLATSTNATGTLQNMTQVAYLWNGDDVTMGHLHCGAAGQNGPVVLDLFHNASSTDVNGLLVATSSVSASNLRATTTGCAMPITSLSDLAQAMLAGHIYANVHSAQHPGGVARGHMMLTSSQSSTTPPMGTTTPPVGTTTPPGPGTTTPPFPSRGLGASISAFVHSLLANGGTSTEPLGQIIRDFARSLRNTR